MGLGLQPAIGRATFRLNSLAARLLPQRRHLITLTYHRVGNREELFPEPAALAECDLEQFEAQMRWLRRHCTVLDLARAMEVIRGGPCPDRAVLVTFDDGYREDLLRVRPCLERFAIRPVVFLPTDYVGTSRRFWWDRVGTAVQLTRRSVVTVELGSGAVERIDLASPTQRNLATERLTAHARGLGSAAQRLSFVERLEQVLELPDGAEADRPLVLSWDEVRELHAVFDFGAHTESHPVLAQLGPEQARRELARSRAIIEQELDRPCPTLAIPYGGSADYTAETVGIAAELGFEAVFSLEETLRPPQRHGATYLVDRIALNSRAGLPGMALKLTWPGLFVPPWGQLLRRFWWEAAGRWTKSGPARR